ncbi:hypothetical protein QBC39DRAFT_410506 [Podospora conica]|nr:hypothetical protein QBC39DRAFT_410506 [Schizothecium conicum]
MEGTVALGSACACYVDGKQARLVKESSADPKPCLDFCRLQFMKSVVPGWTDESRYHDGCQNLTGNHESSRLWPLYWCDSIFCGVAIEQLGGLQQDPNVGRIINTCQNIGSHSVYDPGPPPPSYTCATDLNEAAACTLAGVRVPQATGSASPSRQPTLISSAFPSESEAFGAATVTQAEPKTGPATPSHSKASASASSTRLSSAGAGASATSGSGLSTGAKIAIGVCSGLALAALVALSLFCLYRRRRRKSSRHHSLRSHLGRESDVPPSGSPTPLISTIYSGSKGGEAPLTPPLRLRERRFLPSILRPGSRSSSPPLTPLEPAFNPGGNHGGVFPSSPICSPTTNKLVPRNEEKPRVHGGSFSSLTAPNPPTAPPQAALGGPPTSMNRGSLSSYGGASSITNQSSLRNEVVISPPPPKTTTTGTQTQTTQTQTPSFTYPLTLGPAGTTTTKPRTTTTTRATPPSSPTRPPRPHDTPLEIPDLVTPASPSAAPLGPPPNRALPPPPPPPPALLPPGNTASFSAVGGRSVIPRGVTVVRDSDATTTTGREEDSGSEYGYEVGGGGGGAEAGGNGHGGAETTRASWGSWTPKTGGGRGARGGGGQGMGRAY